MVTGDGDGEKEVEPDGEGKSMAEYPRGGISGAWGINTSYKLSI